MMRSRSRPFIAAAALALLLPLHGAARARAEGWASARTPHFLVVCEDGEAEAWRVARQLERFREALARVLPRGHFSPSAQATILIFRDQSSYAPFKPLHHGRAALEVAGYFQPGHEVNYITVADDEGRASSTLLHEYAHLLLSNYYPHAPLWLKEGFAEFYSTARLSADGRRLTLGAASRPRLRALDGHALLPLAELFTADAGSAHYLDPVRRARFYAQAWALVHHLTGDGAAGRARLTRYLELLAEGGAAEEAFTRAFGVGVHETEAALAARVRRGDFREHVEPLAPAVGAGAEVEVRRLSRAEMLARLGDLLLRSDRLEAAEARLREAEALDPALAATQLSFGVLRLRQGLHAEAREHLQRAVAAAPRDPVALFSLADALQREGLGLSPDDSSVSGFEEKTRMVRAALRRAIELAPGFVEAYRLLAFVELERAGRTDLAAALVAEALGRAPRRADLRLLLAQVRLSEGAFDAARAEAGAVARGGGAPFLREQARRLLALVEERAEQAARAGARAEEAALLAEAARVAALPCDFPEPGPQQKQLRFAGVQACGRLVRIECGEGDGVVLHVETEGGLLRLRAEAINRVRFVTYTAAVKSATRITCGPRDPTQVLVTFRPRRADPDGLDGDAAAVEFIPPDWNR